MAAEAYQRAPQVRERTTAPKAPRINLGAGSMERAATIAAAGIASVHIPSIPPTDPDVDIMDGYAKAMALRAAGYANGTEVSDEEAEAQEPVWCSIPSTIGGVIARLALLMPDLDSNRWVDKILSVKGIGALIARHLDLNDDARHVAQTIDHLIRIDWEQALAAYEAQELALTDILKVKGAIEEMESRIADAEAYQRLYQSVDTAEDNHFAREIALKRLIRTLTPDGQAFRMKMRIVHDELQSDVPGTMDYLDRDFVHVMGRYAAAAQAEG